MTRLLGRKTGVLAGAALLILTPGAALAQGSHNRLTSDPIGFAHRGVTAFAGAASGSLFNSIRRTVNAFLGLAALIAAVMIIVGTVQAALSGGDEDAAQRARNNIIYALLGLVIILLSAVLVNFVIGIFPP